MKPFFSQTYLHNIFPIQTTQNTIPFHTEIKEMACFSPFFQCGLTALWPTLGNTYYRQVLMCLPQLSYRSLPLFCHKTNLCLFPFSTFLPPHTPGPVYTGDKAGMWVCRLALILYIYTTFLDLKSEPAMVLPITGKNAAKTLNAFRLVSQVLK